MKKRGWMISIFVLVVFVFLINSVLAEITFGNKSYSIEESYTPGDFIKGWVNISLDKEPHNSLVKGFETSITFMDFLKANDIDCEYADKCSCTPSSCLFDYSSNGSGQSSLTKSIKFMKPKVIGIKLTGNISSIKSFGFNVSTNAGKSCLRPLVIDFLDNGKLDFIPKGTVDETCYIAEPYGCFRLSDVVESTGIGITPLCQEIVLPPARGYRIGANLIGSGEAHFIMNLNAGFESNINCNLDINNGGEHYCNINLIESFKGGKAEVCIFAIDGASSENYEINYEDNETCGYVGDALQEENRHDFQIFARPLKYKGIDDFRFDNNFFEEEINLSEMIMDYIDEKYYGACDNDCIIPIKFHGGNDQEVSVSDLVLEYFSGGLLKDTITTFYEVEEAPSLISSEFLKLDLESAEIRVPFNITDTLLYLGIGDETIRVNISVKNFPKINNIVPKNPTLLVPSLFILSLDQDISNKSFSFIWNFGDGTLVETTTSNIIKHTYSKMGTYELSVKVSNELGESIKNFTINVRGPYDAINKTIHEYKKNLKNIENQLKLLPIWIQDEIQKVEDVEDLKNSVNRIEKNYKSLFKSDIDELVKLMKELVNLKIPYKIDTDYIIKPSRFIQDKDIFDPLVISDFGDFNYDASLKDKYYSSINEWIEENLNVSFESKTYTAYYKDRSTKNLLSEVKIVLMPKRDIYDFYIIIKGDNTKIKFKTGEDYGARDIDSGYGIRFSELSADEVKTIEFTYPEKIDFITPPIYMSPEFKNLELSVDVGVCNHNGVCESRENRKNCKSDCKPWGTVLILISILIFIALVVYIILQEWYKRNYEKYLFKNKNQLFNLITFMSNCSRQKMKRQDIFDKLRPLGWNREQLGYAWNKLNGFRTGMWEIPIFKVFENIKIKKEIEKRKNLSINQSNNSKGISN